jgi:hypothetical protein
LIDTNPRLRLAFQEDTRTSTLIVYFQILDWPTFFKK